MSPRSFLTRLLHDIDRTASAEREKAVRDAVEPLKAEIADLKRECLDMVVCEFLAPQAVRIPHLGKVS